MVLVIPCRLSLDKWGSEINGVGRHEERHFRVWELVGLAIVGEDLKK